MIFFSKKKMISMIVLFAFMGGCGWFWRHREYIPFVSQPLSVGAAPFEYGVSRAAWAGENGIGFLKQVFSNWKELDELRKENVPVPEGILTIEELVNSTSPIVPLCGFADSNLCK